MEKQIENNQFIIFLLICRWYTIIHRDKQPQKARVLDLHLLPDSGAGKEFHMKSRRHDALKN